MPDFLVESYDPGDASRPWPGALPGLRHLRSIYMPDDEVALHLVRARSAVVVRRALDRAAFPYERVVAAVEAGAAQPHPQGRHTDNDSRQGETPC